MLEQILNDNMDKMAARKEIFQHYIWLNGMTQLYVDIRMNADTGWAYIIDPRDPTHKRQYFDNPEVMFPDSQVNPRLGDCGITLSIGTVANLLGNYAVELFLQAINDPRKVGELVFTVRPTFMLQFNKFARAGD